MRGVAAALAALSIGLALVLYPASALRGLQYDDAYITYRYAANLARGEGLVFNPGERVNSASSLTYTATLAAVRRLGVEDLPAAAVWIGLASVVISLLAASHVLVRSGLSPGSALLVLLPLAASGLFVAWSVSGMETNPYTALVLVFVAAVVSRWRWAAAALAVALVLTRPEGITVVAALAAAALAARRDVRYWAPAITAGAVAFAGYLAFNAAYFGDPLPYAGTFKTLTTYYMPPLSVRLRELSGNVLVPFLPFLAAALGLLAWQAIRRDRLRTDRAFVALTAVGSVAMYALGPREDWGRYVQPAIAVAAIAAGMLALDAARPRLLAAGAAVALALAIPTQVHMVRHFADLAAHQQARLALGAVIARSVPTSVTVLSSDLGALGFAAPAHRFVDVLGLVTPWTQRALRAGDGAALEERLAACEPFVVADTQLPGEPPRALLYLDRPASLFHGVDPSRSFHGLVRPGAELAATSPDGRLRFVLVAAAVDRAWVAVAP